MADDNRPLKYARYAIGEIVLLVIGILIALQINTWNEERIENDKIKTYLNALIVDLNSDLIILEKQMVFQDFRFNSLQKLLEFSGEKPNFYEQDSAMPNFSPSFLWDKPIPKSFDSDFVRLAFISTQWNSEIHPNLSVLNEMKSNGFYSYIDNSKIKLAINDYYQNFESNLGISENLNIRKYRSDWMDALTKNGYTSEEIKDLYEALEWIRNNPEANACLRRLIANAKFRYQIAVILSHQNEKLTNLITKNYSK